MKKLIMIAACVVTTSFAGNYGMAGCGLGAMALGKDGNQILAYTLNNTISPQSTWITTGVSECTEDGVAMADKEIQLFVEVNFESLKQEMAQGQGESIDALAALYEVDASEFATQLQSNYSSIVPTENVSSIEMVENINSVVKI